MPECPHGDATCPCQDGDACNYEDLIIDGKLSPAMACPHCEATR